MISVDELYKMARALTTNQRISDREDLVQDCVMAGFEADKRWNGTGTEAGWVYANMRWKLRSYWNRPTAPTSSLDEWLETNDYLEAPAATTSQRILDLRAALSRLPKQLSALLLDVYSGAAYADLSREYRMVGPMIADFRDYALEQLRAELTNPIGRSYP